MFGRNVIQRMLGGHDQVLAGSALYAVMGGRAERARPGGLGAALIGIAPAWGATPSLSVVAGQAGSAELSLTGNPAPVITVEPADTLPSWVTGLSTSAITWDASAPAGQAYSFRLRATNPFGSATSSVISGTVQAAPVATTGLWGAPLSYSDAIWNYTTRAGAALRSNVAAAAGAASLAGPIYWSKHTQGFYRPTDGRVWLGWGDQSPANLADTDGMFDTNSPNDCQPITVSFTSGSTTMRREFGSRVTDSAPYDSTVWLSADEGFVVHDTVADRGIASQVDSFTLQFFQGGNTWRGEVLTYLNATQFSVPGDLTTTYAVRKAIMVECNVAAAGGAVLKKRGRISASSFGGGVTTVTVAWWNSDFAFQSPVRAVLAVNNGGIQAYNDPSFRESDSKWVTRLWALDFVNRSWQPMVFSVPSQADSGINAKNAVFVPGSITGRGDEVHSWAVDKMTVWNLSSLTVTRPTTGGVPWSENGQCWPCFDGSRYAYIFISEYSQLRRWDVIAQTQTSINVTYQGQVLTDGGAGTSAYLGNKAKWDGVWTFWNAEINRIELWLNRNGVGAEVYADVWLIDPANPTAPELVATQDDAGGKIRTNNPVHVPTVGAAPAHTIALADMSFGGVPAPDKMRFFIAANKRQWQEVTPGAHWYHSFTEFDGKSTDAVSTYSQVSAVPAPIFGNWVPEMDSSGIHTGKVYIRAGGDGDYGGNEVTILRLDQLSGTTYPTQLNTVASSLDASGAAMAFGQWKNRIHTGIQGGGTGNPSEVLINPADLAEWQPVSIHTWYCNTFVPGYGYVEAGRSPTTIGGATTTLRSALVGKPGYTGGSTPARLTDNSYADNLWGASRFVAGAADASLITNSLNYWSESGANAGKWQRAMTTRPSTLACFNPTRNKLVGYSEQSSGEVDFFEWTPGAGSFVQIGSRIAAASVVNGGGFIYAINDPGQHGSAIWWVENDTYLVRRVLSGDNGFLTYNRATNTLTRNKGTYGNAICDAADAAGASIAFVADRTRRRAYWIVGQGSSGGNRTAKIYVSSFDSLWTWREWYVNGGAALTLIPGTGGTETSGWIGIKWAFCTADHLWLGTSVGASNYGPAFDIPSLRVFRLPIY